MDIIGIICEYNPFHNGHVYHLNKIREVYPNSLLILVLNGYFLQRGEISIISKEEKVKIALNYSIDLVVELPFIYGTQSADQFANAAITILNNFHVDKIIFGSECNDITLLTNLAKKQLDLTYSKSVKTFLDQGINYPTALAKATEIDFNYSPNDLLAISYIKAIIKNNYQITPITIKRTNDYHDTTSNNSIISASNIRNKLKNKEDISNYIPNINNSIITINEEIYFKLLKAKIITCDNLDTYLDVDEGISSRLKKYITKANTIEEYISLIKTKRYTYNKLKRMFIHILIGLKKEDANYKLDYIKILGFNKKGKQYINSIKKDINVPITINKDSLIYQYELISSSIYDLINNTNTYLFELSTKPINLSNLD